MDLIFKLGWMLTKLVSNAFMHLDVKPENIMMANYYTPVLIDFGFASHNT